MLGLFFVVYTVNSFQDSFSLIKSFPTNQKSWGLLQESCCYRWSDWHRNRSHSWDFPIFALWQPKVQANVNLDDSKYHKYEKAWQIPVPLWHYFNSVDVPYITRTSLRNASEDQQAVQYFNPWSFQQSQVRDSLKHQTKLEQWLPSVNITQPREHEWPCEIPQKEAGAYRGYLKFTSA